MTTFLVSLATVALALVVPASALSQAAMLTPPTEPSLRTFLPELAGDVRRLPSDGSVSIAIGGSVSPALSTFDRALANRDSDTAFESGTWIDNGVVLAAGTLSRGTTAIRLTPVFGPQRPWRRVR
jgi:hypothetical protein